jgi:hypothetical protein
MSEQPKVQMNFHAPVHGAAGNVEGDVIVNTYNYALDAAIKELQTALTTLQQQHPNVATETQAVEIIDAEITAIKPTSTKLSTLRKQLLNPERHLQASKATLAEVAKHYLEESVWAKAAITYLDTMSAHPDIGA